MVRYTHPEMFYLFIPLTLVLIWYAYQGKKLKFGLETLGTASVKKFLLNRVKYSRIRLRSRLIILGIIFILLASVGPQIGMKLTELTREGVDIFILLDTSASMNAVDVKPSRIEKAKYELGRLLNKLEGDRVGLIAFAGSAHLHCPLTEDYSASRLFLNMMDTDLISTQGTDLAAAIRLALDHVESDEEKFKVFVLVSDGEDHQGEAITLVEQARERGIIIHTLGVGTLAGGPIPIYDVDGNRVEFKKNRSGQVVTSTLNESILDEIARITGGIYIRVENQVNAIGPLLKEIDQMEKRELKSHVFSQYEDRYQVFLVIGLMLFLAEFLIPTRTKKEMVWEGRFTRD
ncbi:VWA domain-containing protein [Candidatus Marinimicrobia bacterium PRS2]|nr:VWA domain-containing protein [Candidatus Marinimicrobia bacterium PRS2]